MTADTAETTSDLLRVCDAVGATLVPEGDRLRVRARAPIASDLVRRIAEQKPQLLKILVLKRVHESWKPGERIAYREQGAIVTATYAGVSTSGAVNVWLADGAPRAIPQSRVALDWVPVAAEVFEERLAVILQTGISEEVARERAQECTRDFLNRIDTTGKRRETH